MTDLFSTQEKAVARNARKKLLVGWFAMLFVVLAIVVTAIVVSTYLVGELRNRDHTVWLGVVSAIVFVLFACYTLFFFAIKFRLTNKYVRMLNDMERGLKDEVIAKFMGYDESVSMKDGVYFYSMVLEARPLKREDITVRKVLIEHTKQKLDLEVGQKLRVVSHANIMVSYEIIDEKINKENI